MVPYPQGYEYPRLRTAALREQSIFLHSTLPYATSKDRSLNLFFFSLQDFPVTLDYKVLVNYPFTQENVKNKSMFAIRNVSNIFVWHSFQSFLQAFRHFCLFAQRLKRKKIVSCLSDH
jgi:hypothetical protein